MEYFEHFWYRREVVTVVRTARQLGQQAVIQVGQDWSQILEEKLATFTETIRRQLESRKRAAAHELERITQLKEAIKEAKPILELQRSRRLGRIYAFCAAVLAIPGAIGNYYSVEWQFYRTPLAGWLIASGTTLGSVFSVEFWLKQFKRRDPVFLTLATVGVVLFLSVTVLLAMSRGIVTEGPESPQLLDPEVPTLFSQVGYWAAATVDDIAQRKDKLQSLMTVIVVLLAIGSELASGVFLNQAFELFRDVDLKNYRQLERAEKKKAALEDETERIEDMVPLYRESFEDAARDALSEKRAEIDWQNKVKRLIWVVFGILGLVVLFAAYANAGPLPKEGSRDELCAIEILALDCSKSMRAVASNGKTWLANGKDAITRRLREVGPCTEVRVVEIGSDTFQSPRQFMRYRTPPRSEIGFWEEYLNEARERMVRSWLQVSQKIDPKHGETDFLGLLAHVSDAFESLENHRSKESAVERRLLTFSDLQNSTRGQDWESTATIDVEALMKSLRTKQLIPPLKGVTLYAYLVHPAGKSPEFWRQQRALMGEIMLAASGRLGLYTAQTYQAGAR